MKSIKKIILIIFILLFIIPVNVFGADSLYRLMHNDHDALVIAEVTDVAEMNVKFRVEKSIVSKKNLSIKNRKKQLNIDEFKLGKEDFPNISLFGISNEDENIKIGDTFLISLNRQLLEYKIAWGIYKTSSLDYKTLDILYSDDASDSEKMDAAAIKCFVNSNGKVTEFSFDGTKKIVKSGNKVIYDGSRIQSDAQDVSESETIAHRTSLITQNRNIRMGILPFALAVIALIIAIIRSKK